MKQVKKIMPAVIVLATLTFLLTVYIPVETYAGNKGEYWFDLSILLPVLLKYGAFFWLAAVAVYALLSKILPKVYRLLLAATFALTLYFYIQSNYLAAHLPALDGTAADWSQYGTDNIISVIVLSICLMICLVFSCKKRKLFQTAAAGVSGCLFLLLLVTLVSVCVINNAFEKKANYTITDKDELVMSSDENYIIILLDAYDGESFQSLLEEKPEYQTVFADFTSYTNMMGAYPFTSRAVPYIFYGEWFENTEPYEDWQERAFAESPLLAMVGKDGYQVGIYESDYPSGTSYHPENQIDQSTLKSGWELFLREVRFSCFKAMPYALKKYFMEGITEYKDLQEVSQEYNTIQFQNSNLAFYEKLQTEQITLSQDKVFKWIHLDGAHVPFAMDENANLIEDGTYMQEVEGCITILDTYFKLLKESGVYDNSVIIVMGDHGYNDIDTYGRQNPVFLVKGRNESHELVTDNAPVAHEDLQEAFVRLENGSLSSDIFDWQEGDERERRFLFFYYLHEEDMTEYIQTGEAKDTDTMYATGREYHYAS